jgi:hypothetical protein
MVSLPDLIQETRFRVPTRESLFEDGHWHGPVTMLGIQPSYAGLAGVQPSHMGRVGHSKKNIQRNYLNICDFPPIFTAF